MLGYCTYIPNVKLNTDWQIRISSKFIFIASRINFITVLQWVDNFWLCKKYLRFLAKNVNFFTKNVFLGELKSRLGEI